MAPAGLPLELLIVKLAIFDLDGTVFDSSALVAPAIWRALDRLEAQTPGLSLRRPDAEEVFGLLGLPNSRYVQALGYDLSPEQWGLLKVWVEESEVELIRAGQGRIYDGILPLLDRLRGAGIPCVVASNCGRLYLQAIFSRFGLDRWMSDARCNDDMPHGDKADLLTMLVTSSACCAAEAVYFGDRCFDVEAAREAGTQFIACSWGFGKNDAFPAGLRSCPDPQAVAAAIGLLLPSAFAPDPSCPGTLPDLPANGS